jgi:hypothetical protein
MRREDYHKLICERTISLSRAVSGYSTLVEIPPSILDLRRLRKE